MKKRRRVQKLVCAFAIGLFYTLYWDLAGRKVLYYVQNPQLVLDIMTFWL